MKNLKKINYKLNLLIFLLIFIFYSQNSHGTENKIIFKINDYPFTSFDLEKILLPSTGVKGTLITSFG